MGDLSQMGEVCGYSSTSQRLPFDEKHDHSEKGPPSLEIK